MKRVRVVVVTGASSDVDRAIARAFAAHSDRVALIARGAEGLSAAAREVEELGGRALVLPLDVSNADAVEAAAAAVVDNWGRIDVWVDAMAELAEHYSRLSPAPKPERAPAANDVERGRDVAMRGIRAQGGRLALIATVMHQARGTGRIRGTPGNMPTTRNAARVVQDAPARWLRIRAHHAERRFSPATGGDASGRSMLRFPQGTGRDSAMSMSEYPVWITLLVFAISSAAIWGAGARLEHYADALSQQTGMGAAFTGVLLLAAATSLPELATTITAVAVLHDATLAVNNLLGGVAMQTALLVVADVVKRDRARPLNLLRAPVSTSPSGSRADAVDLYRDRRRER